LKKSRKVEKTRKIFKNGLMKIFQFFINPGGTFGTFFDCFCFEPKNIYERKLGSLYIIGEIKTMGSKGKEILKDLAFFLKERFYKKAGLKEEKALEEALKETNSFLEKKLREENSGWLGTFSLAVINLKNFRLRFTKVGNIKIQLIRGGKLYDLDKKIKMGEIQLYPLRIFGKIAFGKLLRDDLIFVQTKKIFNFLRKEGFFERKKDFLFFDERKTKKFFEERKENLKNVSGIFFVLSLTKEQKEQRSKIESEKKEFSLKEALLPLLEKGKILKKEIEKQINELLSNEKWRLILTFIFVLLLGFLFSRLF